jgi:V/A-type H+/Na+-transporting ATPase subunit A
MKSIAKNNHVGKVSRISGSVVFATGFEILAKNTIVRIGRDQILGEVVQILDDTLVIQSYEETDGVRVGDFVHNTNEPYYATLGPGLLGKMVDGLQRPMESLADLQGAFLKKGTLVDPFDHSLEFEFHPLVNIGDKIPESGEFGYVMEKKFKHPIMLPPLLGGGKVKWIAEKGWYNADDRIVEFEDGRKFGFYHKWEIRKPRKVKARMRVDKPFITGQRVLDSFFPIAKGGTSIVSGGFGTGKTVLEQAIAKHSRVDIIVLVLIGERGNEVASVLSEFAELTDEDGNPLMDRTVIIVNTSNMPVAARESSIFLGMTIGEYYRDLGLDVAVLADSMSRWAEAVREISGRLEEMPVEEGYPSYMPKNFGEFFERAGNFLLMTEKEASLTFIAAISPQGGDFTEPVTQAALRVTGGFWALNTELARSRHFPSVDWRQSYSLYGELISTALQNEYPKWGSIRSDLLLILKQEEELEQNVRLLGRDSLSEEQKAVLDMARFIKLTFMQQDSFDEIDQDSSIGKQYLMLQTLHLIWKYVLSEIRKGRTSRGVFEEKDIVTLSRIREVPETNLVKYDEWITMLTSKIEVNEP